MVGTLPRQPLLPIPVVEMSSIPTYGVSQATQQTSDVGWRSEDLYLETESQGDCLDQEPHDDDGDEPSEALY